MEGKNLKMVGWLFGLNKLTVLCWTEHYNAQKPTDRLTDHKGKAVQIRLKPARTGNKRNRNRQEQHHNLVSRMKDNE